MEFPSWWSQEGGLSPLSFEDMADDFTLETGLPLLDRALNGGLKAGKLIEVYGEAGTGKTNLAISLVLRCAAVHGRSWYVSTFKPISRARLEQVGVEPAMIAIKHCSSLAEVDQALFADLPQALEKGENVRLVILDPVSGLVNEAFMEDAETGVSARALYLTRQALVLKHLSSKYQFITLLINTLATDVQTGTVRAALGLTWSNLVNERIRASRDGRGRRLTILWSNEGQHNEEIPFQITATGIAPEL